MSLLLKDFKLSQNIPKQCCCLYQTYSNTRFQVKAKGNFRKSNNSLLINENNLSRRRNALWEQVRFAGHSKWSNIKFKKMHKDNARARVFGKLSLEIIQVVRENGPDPSHNHKLGGIIMRAKSANMPKDKIETSIKNALRDTGEKFTRILVQVRGPGKCGLMIDILSPNIVRCKYEINRILKKNYATLIEDGSVAFMFSHKGVLTSEAFSSTDEIDDDEKAQAEEIAIEIGAEDVFFDTDEDRNVYHFICPPLELYNLQKNLTDQYKEVKLLSADTQYLAKSLIDISDDLMTRSDKLIDLITDYPDVVAVYDNMKNYPSKTIKISDNYG